MTRLSDLLQIALSLDQPWNFLAALAILCAIWQGWKIFAAIWRAFIWVVKRVWVIRIRFGFEQGWFWGIIKTGFIAGLAALICAFSAPISDGLQWMEQRYLVKSKDEEVTIKEWHTVKVSDCGKFVIN